MPFSEASPRPSAIAASVLVFLAGLAMAVLAGVWHRDAQLEAERMQFARQSVVVYHAMRAQMASGAQLARAVQASMRISEDLDEQGFQDLYDALSPRQELPALRNISYARFHQNGEMGDTYRVQFIAPLQGNAQAMGDIVEMPENISAIRRAEMLRTPVVSSVFVSPRDKSQVVSIRLPLYRNDQVQGSIGVSIDMAKLVAEALARAGDPPMGVRVVDASQQDRPVVHSAGEIGTTLVGTQLLAVGDRSWEITLGRPVPEDLFAGWPRATFFGGVIMALLCSLLVFNLLGTRAKARALAAEMAGRYKGSEERFRLLNEYLPGFVLLVEPDGRVAYANHASRKWFGIEPGADMLPLFGLSPADLSRELSDHRVRVRSHEGDERWVSLTIRPFSVDGKPHLIALGSDVSQLVELSRHLEAKSRELAFQAQQLEFQAHHDPLTLLPNRRAFEQRLEEVVAIARTNNTTPAVLYLDLDQFKVVNDTAGHQAGDALLVQVADGLRQALGSDAMITRVGGDEFVILHESSSIDSAVALADAIRAFFQAFSFDWAGQSHRLSWSIGINVFDGQQTPSDFLSRADAACYLAKEKGRNRWQVYEGGGESQARHREMGWVARIRQALDDDRIELYRQDIVPLSGASGQPHFEILCRLRDPSGRLVPASEFMVAAERYGLMDQIDRWVLAKVLDNFDRLHPDGPAGLCSVNVSAATIGDPGFGQFLVSHIEKARIDPSRLCIEITETSAISNMQGLAVLLPRLRAMGVKIALDDFGTGMSSFGYLKQINVDLIKIDGSFVRDIDNDPKSLAIVQAVVDIARQMKIQVVAEWVVSQAVCDKVRDLGVEYGQGYYLGAPQPCLARQEGQP